MPTENQSSNEQKMPSELMPCPFCGQQDAFVEQLDSDASVVICQGRIDKYSACLARGPVGVQQDESEAQPGHDAAVNEWNRRAADQHQGDPAADDLEAFERHWYAQNFTAIGSFEARKHFIAGAAHVRRGEVERLRAELSRSNAAHESAAQHQGELNTRIYQLEEKLAEREALLRDILTRPDLPTLVRNWIDRSLSGSAEPEVKP
ncbi:Lar family restriction alleviation protein [Pseudomonas asplenii]|uniref:Lar family restriction alleviation protein n=1 Tax=Pseudomonas asplenii TaxID=53407 RepID=UPI0023622E4B|nr:Lar family restriction alleviation protein [Pseudomonas asplenii]